MIVDLRATETRGYLGGRSLAPPLSTSLLKEREHMFPYRGRLEGVDVGFLRLFALSERRSVNGQ